MTYLHAVQQDIAFNFGRDVPELVAFTLP